jgi:hypothetical protein
MRSLVGIAFLTLAGCSMTSVVDDGRHIRGIAKMVSSARLDVQTSDGRIVEVRLTPETRFFEHDLQFGPQQLKTGDRVAVELSGLGDPATAATVQITSPGEAAHSRHGSEEQPWRER